MTGDTERTAADVLTIIGAVAVLVLLVGLIAGFIFATFFAH